MEVRRTRVLLVDDDKEDFILTRDWLSEAGAGNYDLDWVADYKTALEEIARHRHDVYLMDYRLGGQDGLSLLREAITNGCTAPIILLTRMGDLALDFEAMGVGAADYLGKDEMTPALLERSIRYAISQKNTEAALRQARDELEGQVQQRTAELRRRLDELNAANKIIEAASSAKDQFLAMLGHELRTPLAAVNNAVTILKMSDEKETRDWASDVAERQVKQLTHLIDDLLDVSRITSGKIRLRKEIVDVASVLNNAVESVRPLILGRQHQLVQSFQPGLLRVEADSTRLEQIFVNLLANAAKYTEPGGRIELAADSVSDVIVITVRDTGVGIAAEVLPQIFDLFAQGERSIARSEGGLGVGLTIVQKLTEMHGGRVSASSEGVGRGSEFVVRLPAADQSQQAPKEPTARQRLGRTGCRILVVDDNADTATGMTRLLALLGNEVRMALDGYSAIETATAFGPDFVLLDIGLPGIDGYQVAARLRLLESCKATVIIAISGYGQEEDRRRSRAAGFDYHLVKPVEHNALLTILAEHTGSEAS
jgi:signal transduction histidine kinase